MASANVESAYKQTNAENEYYNKVKELGKHLDPLKELLEKKSDTDRQKVKKVDKLIYILSNPNKVCVPLETLLKCEKALDTTNGPLTSFACSSHTAISQLRGKVSLSKNMFPCQ